MTYSLNTLRATARQAPVAPTGMGRFANEITLIVGFVGLVLWLVALLTYAPQDAAWSTSGAGMPVLNRVGRLGAWVADLSYFVLGFSVWWCVVVAVRLWLALLAHRLRDDASPVVPRQWVFWLGMLVINALLFMFVGRLVDGFVVTSFWSALGGAVIVSLTNYVLIRLLAPRRAFPGQPDPKKRSDVIDI